MRRIQAKAVVTLTLSVPVRDFWGEDCTVGQIHKQAIQSALAILAAGLKIDAIHAELVGTPVVKHVLAETDDSTNTVFGDRP